MTDGTGTHVAEREVEIDARPETVFGCFTDPAAFAAWMGAAHGAATIDPVVGGALVVDYAGAGKVVRGEVLVVDAPRHFAFTWGYEDGMPFEVGSTRVDITLTPTERGTHLLLRHSGLPSEIAANEHGKGWRLYSSVLAAHAAAVENTMPAIAAVKAWFDAWTEHDVEKRRGLVAACMTDDGQFRHAYAAVTGQDALVGHISASLATMPDGLTIEADGAPRMCHRYVQFGWKAVHGGNAVATGSNFGVLAPDGRFEVVAGF